MIFDKVLGFCGFEHRTKFGWGDGFVLEKAGPRSDLNMQIKGTCEILVTKLLNTFDSNVK